MQTEVLKTIVRAVVPRSVRNSLRSPSRSAEWVTDCARFFLGSRETLDLPCNWSLVCHPHVYRVAHEAQVADPEQREEFLGFVSHCSERMFLFDIGAHFGIFSLTAAHFGGKAIAVDPSPTATRMIATEAALNGLTDRVRVIRAAVSDGNGVMGLLSSGVFSHGYFKVAKGRPGRELTQVESLTIDHMARQFGAPTHIKIDVEGHETAVLRGAKATLRDFSPVIFLELHNEMIAAEGADPGSALDELDALGYATFRPDGGPFDRSAVLGKAISRTVAMPRTARPAYIDCKRTSTS
jgi:FkbM family methyltransferase